MTTLLNLLPWRQQQRRLRAQIWGVLLFSTLLISLSGGVILKLAAHWEQQELQAQARYLANSRQSLQMLYQQRQEIYQQFEQRQRRQQIKAQRQAETKRWQQWIILLAQALPHQMWLTSLSAGPHQMVLSGVASTEQDLQRFEESLSGIADFRALEAGALQRNPQGLLTFTFMINLRGKGDADN